MSPEARRGEALSEAGDMWTLGVLAYLVLMGPFPQPGMTQEAAWASIMVGKPLFKGRGWKGRSPEAADFVSRLLQVCVVDACMYQGIYMYILYIYLFIFPKYIYDIIAHLLLLLYWFFAIGEGMGGEEGVRSFSFLTFFLF